MAMQDNGDQPAVRAVELSGNGAGLRNPWVTGWPIVLSSFLCYGLSITHAYAFSVFIAPIEHDVGWTRAEISSGLLFNSVIGGLSSPFIGILIDRYGSRRIALPGMMVYCAAIALLSTSTASIWNWWALWALVACGAALVKPTVWAAAVSQKFDQSRGLALSITLSGGGAAAMILPPLAFLLISHGGWRWAFAALGIGAACLTLPLLLFFFKAGPASRDMSKPIARTTVKAPWRGAVFSPAFMKIIIVALMMTCAATGMQIHFVSVLNSFALPLGQAAAYAALLGFGSIAGRLATGALLDRFPGTVVGAIVMALPATGAVVLLSVSALSPLICVVAALSFGLATGAELSVLAYLTARYFGLARYGFLFGFVSSMFAIGTGVGPTIGGALYDHYHSYRPFLLFCLFCFLASALLIARLGRYPDAVSAD